MEFYYIIKRIRKYLICIWLHRKHRCYPHVWDKDSKYWHCMKCYPCGSDIDYYLHKSGKKKKK